MIFKNYKKYSRNSSEKLALYLGQIGAAVSRITNRPK